MIKTHVNARRLLVVRREVEEEQKFQLSMTKSWDIEDILYFRKTLQSIKRPISRLDQTNYTIVEQQKYREMR